MITSGSDYRACEVSGYYGPSGSIEAVSFPPVNRGLDGSFIRFRLGRILNQNLRKS